MESGFIKLSRRFFSHEMWEAARTFSECEAWLDLIQSARFDATVTIERIGGRDIKYGRGQFPASIRFLSVRWTWGERKVRVFLDKLKKEKMITTSSAQGMNIITLCKYDEYNSNGTAKDTPKDTVKELDYSKLADLVTQRMTQQRTQSTDLGHSEDTKKKKEKNTKETTTNVVVKKNATNVALLAKRKDDFYQSLIPYKDIYPKEMLRIFFDYWSEMNRSKTKMRFEQQKTWETSKRLANWARKEENYATTRRNTAKTSSRTKNGEWTNEDTAEFIGLSESVQIGR